MARFSAAALVLVVSFRRARSDDSPSNDYYPDWSGGSGTCLNDTPLPSFFRDNPNPTSYLEPNLEACCGRYYGNTQYNDCVTGGGGTIVGTNKYYPAWTESTPRCASDCAPASDAPQCGGILGPGVGVTYNDPATCCAAHFASQQPDYCAALALGTSYEGGGKFYLDQSEHICVQDCDGPAPCGGVVKQLWVELFDTIAECCSTKLPALDPDFCAAQSDPEISATNKWFVDGNGCSKDCEGSGPECGSYSGWGTLYNDAALCCSSGLAWVTEEYCKSRSDPDSYGVPVGEESTGLFYVDFPKGYCVKDCTTSEDPTCQSLGNKGQSIDLYSTAAECCSAKLSWNDNDSCAQTSLAGSAAEATGTNKWYADYASKKRCVVDCPTTDENPNCGGVASGGGVSKYDTVAQCCEEKFGWYDSNLCEAISTGVGHTGKWYVNYQDGKCDLDCPAGQSLECEEGLECATCGGNPSSFSETLYDTPQACCEGKLSYEDNCLRKSIYAKGSDALASDQWYADYQNNKCLQDCPEGVFPSCHGVVDKSSGTQFYTTVAGCCSSKFNWINEELCRAQSLGESTSKFYADQQNRVCKQDCPEGSGLLCAGSPTDFSEPLFTDVDTCCSTRLSWVSEHLCEQTPASEAGSDEYYIKWSVGKCVKNCVTSNGPECGGLAESYDVLYSNSGACCAQPFFSWMEPGDCRQS